MGVPHSRAGRAQLLRTATLARSPSLRREGVLTLWSIAGLGRGRRNGSGCPKCSTTRARKSPAQRATSTAPRWSVSERQADSPMLYSAAHPSLKPLARYFGRAKDLPGVRELLEQQGTATHAHIDHPEGTEKTERSVPARRRSSRPACLQHRRAPSEPAPKCTATWTRTTTATGTRRTACLCRLRRRSRTGVRARAHSNVRGLA